MASGETMLEATIMSAASALAEVLVVLRATDDHFARELANNIGYPEVRYFCAPDAHLGMGHSLANAIGEVPGWDAAMVILGDLPFILPSTYRTLAATYAQHAARHPILLPRYLGKQGHPVLFDRRYFGEIANLTGDVGARSIVREHAEQVIDVEVDDPGILQDIDRPDDIP